MSMKRKLNKDNGLQDWKTEHQAVTGGIFYCHMLGAISRKLITKFNLI
jgi:hypothetical protein